MQIIHIMPVDNRAIVTNQPMHMLLTHLVESASIYRGWCQELEGYKILDNSLIELGGAVDIKRVVDAAITVNADEIILPDVFLDGPGTVAAVQKALSYLYDNNLLGRFELMAVCQGKDVREFHECFRQLNACDAVNVIGIPKVCAKLSPGGRPDFEVLWNTDYCKKDIHLLGVWYSWEELFRFTHPARIRSVDSVLAAYLAQGNMPFTGVRPDGHTVDLISDRLTKEEANRLVLLDKVGV